jgi:hypothetical protein
MLDDAWIAVREYCERDLKQQEPCLFDSYSEEHMQQILEKHHKITALAKEKGLTRLFGALIIVDDFADDPRVCRSSKSLHELYVRGRHAGISCVSSVQKFRVLAL